MTFIDYSGMATPIDSWLLWTVIIVSAVVTIGFYLLRSIGIYMLAKKHNVGKCKVLSWIPVAWVYVVAKLAGNIKFFGKPVKAFSTIVLIVALISEAILFAVNVMHYIPIIGYYLQGGEVLISMTEKFFPVGSPYLSTGSIFICVPNIQFPYGESVWNLLNVLYSVQNVLSFVYLALTIFMYSAFFKAYLPNHYLVATVFSVLGLFPPFVFAVRKNEKIDFDSFMRAQYAAFYGMPPNGANPYNRQNPTNESSKEEPFGEFNDKKEPFEEFKEDEPFNEFDQKSDK